MIPTETLNSEPNQCAALDHALDEQVEGSILFRAFCHSPITTPLNNVPGLYDENKDSSPAELIRRLDGAKSALSAS